MPLPLSLPPLPGLFHEVQAQGLKGGGGGNEQCLTDRFRLPPTALQPLCNRRHTGPTFQPPITALQTPLQTPCPSSPNNALHPSLPQTWQ